MAGQPFFTPSFLGGVLFLGESVETVAGFNLEGGSLAAMALFMPGVEAVIGQGTVLLANVVTAAAMTVFLRQAHCSAESEILVGVGSPAGAL